MRIKIEELEKKLGYKIKKNYKVIGCDTARIAGIAFIKTDDEYAHLDWCYLEFEKNSQEELLTQMYKEFGKTITNENFAVVEEVFLGFSRAGSLLLAKMGTLAIAQCISKGIPFKLISAVSARAKFKIDTRKFGKGKSKEAVSDWINNSLNIELNENNCADALVLAFVGICENMNYAPKTLKKKKVRTIAKKIPKKKLDIK